MARPEGSRNTLIAITYDTIGEMAGGIAGDTARQYAQRGQFDPRNLDSLLAWVNARRTTKRLPMIGVPAESESQPHQLDSNTTSSGPALNHPNSGGYNPLTAEFQE